MKASSNSHLWIYALVWILSVGIVSLELVGSWLSGSRALLADVGHVLSDTVLALVPLTAALLMRVGLNARRIAFWSTLAAVAILIGIGFHVGGEAWEALTEGHHHEHEVDGILLFLFSGAAAIANFVQHRLLSRIDPIHHHGAHKGLHFHVLMDLVKNLALPVLGLGIAFALIPESSDLWAALVIGALLIVRALLLLKSLLFDRSEPHAHQH